MDTGQAVSWFRHSIPMLRSSSSTRDTIARLIERRSDTRASEDLAEVEADSRTFIGDSAEYAAMIRVGASGSAIDGRGSASQRPRIGRETRAVIPSVTARFRGSSPTAGPRRGSSGSRRRSASGTSRRGAPHRSRSISPPGSRWTPCRSPSLIDLVEHADEDRADSQGLEDGELPPVELALATRRSSSTPAWPGGGCPRRSRGTPSACNRCPGASARPGRASQTALRMPVHPGVIAISAGVPGADGVEHPIDLRPGRIRPRLAARASARRGRSRRSDRRRHTSGRS